MADLLPSVAANFNKTRRRIQELWATEASCVPAENCDNRVSVQVVSRRSHVILNCNKTVLQLYKFRFSNDISIITNRGTSNGLARFSLQVL